MQNPELSIIMLSFNSELYIREAIQSILGQTYRDFELIIIDDASVDDSLSIIKSFRDSRIILIRNEKNMGIVNSRNHALKVARGNYIACFDSDDIAHPSKFEKQIDFLNRNDDFGFVGSAVKLIDERGHVIGKWKLQAKAEMIPAIMLFNNYFVNSAVVIRRSMLGDIHYHEGLEIGEDYLMWWWLLQKSKAINLPEYLTFYRQHRKSQMYRKAIHRIDYDTRVYEYILKQSAFKISKDDMKIHIHLKDKDPIRSYGLLMNNMDWLVRLWHHFKTTDIHKPSLRKIIMNRWMKVGFKTRKKPLLFLSVMFNFTFYFEIFLKEDK